MMKKGLKYAALSSLAVTAVAVAPVATDAAATTAEPGFYDVENNKYYSAPQFKMLSSQEKVKLLTSPSVYLHLGSTVGVVSATDARQATTQAELEAKLVPVDSFKEDLDAIYNGSTEFVVTSVSAITTTVDAGENLEFAVNGETKAVDLEKFAAAGYTVSFTASKAVFDGKSTSTTGKVTAAVGTTFDYTVTVLKNGEVVDTSGKVSAKVIDSTAVVTEITEVEFTNDGSKGASTTLANGERVQLKVLGKTKDQAADAEAKDITSLVTFSSDVTAIATVNEAGLVKKGSAAGEVTITAKVGELSKVVKFTAVNEARAFDAKKSSVVTNSIETVAGDVTVEVEIKDNFGDAVTTATKDRFNVAGQSVKSATFDKKTGKYTVTLENVSADFKDAEVQYSGTKIGTLSVKILKADETASYKLETVDKKYELDLANKSKIGGSDPTLTLKIVGYDKAGLVSEADVSKEKYAFASKDEKVATVNGSGVVTAKSTGSTEVYVYLAEDGFKTPVATTTITVVDKTPKITGVTFGKDLKFTSTTTDNASLDITKIVEKISVGTGTATVATSDGDGINAGDIIYTVTTDEGESKFKLGTLAVSANTITVEQEEAKIKATSTNTVGKDTVSVNILDIKGNLTSYSTTITADLATKDALLKPLVEAALVQATDGVNSGGQAYDFDSDLKHYGLTHTVEVKDGKVTVKFAGDITTTGDNVEAKLNKINNAEVKVDKDSIDAAYELSKDEPKGVSVGQYWVEKDENGEYVAKLGFAFYVKATAGSADQVKAKYVATAPLTFEDDGTPKLGTFTASPNQTYTFEGLVVGETELTELTVDISGITVK